MTRRCCPGCGAPAPLAFGQDWCRYCKEFIGVSKDMSAAVVDQNRLSPDQLDRLTDALENLEGATYEAPTDGVDHIARNLMADPSWAARLEACREEDRVSAEVAAMVPTDWAGMAGRFAINMVCAVIVAVPVTMALWAVAVAMMGQS